ncbi:glucosamine-6-phosphate deaminase [Clostridium sp. SHJSY1]|uniref:glucosamine-6-phosphate deaminase n=1 Tax=Clostridium sp. SHJSY1 TaxID=2942483 RepID=UPI002875AC19|nr:glucosamine-6-phosphate deaminase [Clostridium sp. SHJSY1]MDS0528076.1 glucosamine-6-phosphate deaminase [Clostridium sp. SHJSY1]
MRILVCENYDAMSKMAAQMIVSQITLNPNSILGLATGGTAVGMYENLVEMHKKGLVDFSQVKSFNLDEYYRLDPSNNQSYRYFMDTNLFNHVNIKKENTKVPNGMADDIEQECINYDESIKSSGGIDIQVLGIGNNSHIGFNEPTENFENITHIVELDESTRLANSRYFKSIDEVPEKAVTMGIGTIFRSKKIMLLASGKNKAQAIHDTIYGEIRPEIPSSILHLHKDVVLILDKEAAGLLDESDYKLV